jgi:hypothetical protein
MWQTRGVRLATLSILIAVGACGGAQPGLEPGQQRITLSSEPDGGEVLQEGLWHSLDDGYTFDTSAGPTILEVRHAAESFTLRIITDPPGARVHERVVSPYAPIGITPVQGVELPGPGPLRLELQRPGY